MDPWTVTLSLVIVLATWYYYRRTQRFFSDRGIPYLPGIPVFGSFWNVVFQRKIFTERVKEIYDLHPTAKYVGLFDFTVPVVALRDIELVKDVSVKYFEQFTDRRSTGTDTDPLFSKNLFTLGGERWREVRTTLSPAFTSSKMKAMYKLMIDCARRYGNFLGTLPEGKRTLELKDVFTRYTNDVIATCAFGVEVDSLADRDNEFYTNGRKAANFDGLQSFKFFLLRSLPFVSNLLRLRLLKPNVANFFKEMVASTIKYRDSNGVVRPDMLQLMMDARGKLGEGKELTIEDMTAQAFIFFLGGFESTSTLMAFTAYRIGIDPEIQRKVHEEIDEVLAKCNGVAAYDAINDMKYLEAVMYEALRMYPVISIVERACTKPFELPPALPGLKPHVLQRGDYIWVPVYGFHFDPDHFEEPEKFNPDRFMDDPRKLANSGAFLGFGIGPRMCIGNRFALLETKVLLFHMLARCTLKPCARTAVPIKLSKKGFQIKPVDGFWFDVEPRKVPVYVNSMGNSYVAS